MKRKAPRPLYYVEVDELDEATPRQLTCVRASSIHDGNFNADRFLQEWRNNGRDREFWNRVDAYGYCFGNQIAFFESRICGVQLHPGVGYEVKVTRWYSPKEFSVTFRLFDKLLQSMSDAISVVYSEIAAFLPSATFTVGMPCCVKDRGGTWRRALIERILLDEYHVVLVDFGVLMYVPKGEVSLLLKYFCEMPPLSVCCHVHEFEMRLVDRPTQNFFKRKTNKARLMTFTALKKNELVVQLFNNSGQNLCELLEIEESATMVQTGCDQPTSLSPGIVLTEKNRPRMLCASTSGSRSPTAKPRFYEIHGERGVFYPHFESLKRLPLPHVLTNVQSETKILAFNAETGIGLFRLVDEECRLGFIENYLRAQAAIMPWGHVSQEWEIGDACVVRGSLEDNKFYRAVIVAILPGECAAVDYCDYTFQASGPLRELCPLIDNAVTSYPPLAFRAKIPCLTMEAQNGVAIEERLNSVGLFTNVWKTTFAIDGDGQLSASIGC
uniref:Tudor domain-containing protein n=1 Tax=Trichuris muris TaxID=70415 RepID=A0A5S6Q7F4_TRIMR